MRPHLIPPWLTALLLGLLAIPASLQSQSIEGAHEAALKTIEEFRLIEKGVPALDVTMIAFGTEPITLPRALEIAVANNGGMRTAREAVYRAALNLVAVRRGYLPQLRAESNLRAREIGITPTDFDRYSDQYTTSVQTLGLSQRLPFGGNISLDVGGSYAETNGADGTYAPRTTLSLSQPLLRGAGRDLQQEPLIAARNNLLYALRTYRTTVQDFSIAVINDYLTLQNLRKKVSSIEEKRASFEHLINRSQMFYELGRESELEVLRATQEKLLVDQELLNLKLEIENRSAQFGITLNHPTGRLPELVEFPIPLLKIYLQADEAVELAMTLRPDLKIAADLIEDNRRAVKFAKREFLPSLDLNLSANAANTDVRTRNGRISEEYAAGVTLSLPLERTRERVALYGAWLNLQQNERALEIARATMAASVRHAFNKIKSIESTIAIQDLVIQSSTKGAEIASFRYERGEISNRNVIEAATTKAVAINSRLNFLQQHYISMLRLQGDIGQLESTLTSLTSDASRPPAP